MKLIVGRNWGGHGWVAKNAVKDISIYIQMRHSYEIAFGFQPGKSINQSILIFD